MSGVDWPGRRHPGRGSWECDPGHFPLPLTPVFADFYLPAQEEAIGAMFRRFGYLAEGIRTRLVRGHLYYTVCTPGGVRPPARLTGAALYLWWAFPPTSRRVRLSIRRYRSGYPARVLQRWREQWRPRVESELRAAIDADLSALDDAALLEHLRLWLRRARRNVRLHFLLHGAIAPEIWPLEQLCRRLPALAGLSAASLVAGLSPASTAPTRALREMGAWLCGHPDLLTRALEAGPRALAARLKELDSEFARMFTEWIARYGHRVVGRYEFVLPTLAEQPERVAAIVLELAAHPPAAMPDPAEAAVSGAEGARAHMTGGERVEFDRALAAARAAFPVRDENVVLLFSTTFAVVRAALREAGSRLVGRGLAVAGDVFFLQMTEVEDALAGRPGPFFAEHAAARCRTWQRLCAEPPPPPRFGRPLPEPPLGGLPRDARLMTGAILWYMRGIQALDEPPPNAPPLEPDPSTVVRGVGAARGRHRGIARVLTSESEAERLEPGDILVCGMTSPAWSAVLPLAGAIVTDYGGMLSHAAVIAREFGVAAVVATRNGTRRIPDGALVEVDGDSGTVTVLQPPSRP